MMLSKTMMLALFSASTVHGMMVYAPGAGGRTGGGKKPTKRSSGSGSSRSSTLFPKEEFVIDPKWTLKEIFLKFKVAVDLLEPISKGKVKRSKAAIDCMDQQALTCLLHLREKKREFFQQIGPVQELNDGINRYRGIAKDIDRVKETLDRDAVRAESNRLAELARKEN